MAYNALTNTIDSGTVQNGQYSSTNPAFQSGGVTSAPIQPGQNIGSQTTLGAVNTSLATTPPVSNTPTGQTNPIGQIAPITTTQPSPTTVNPTPYTGTSIVDALNQGGQASDFNSRTKLAQQYGITDYVGSADQNTQLLQKYKTGLATAQASGKTAPVTSSDGSKMVSDITGGATPPPSINPVDTIMAQDKAHTQYLADYKKLTDFNEQRTSLVDEYKQMQKDANIPALNAEALNMKNVIDGTEDDIRNEITKAGGFATESQVLALAGARNKGLIKNYNALQQTIQNATQNINTMMGLSQQDKEYATNSLKDQLGFDQKEMEYTDKMNTNAKDAYQKIIDNKDYGYKGLYSATGGDPNTVKLVEDTLGLPSGSLAQLATQEATGKLSHVQLSDGRDVMVDEKGNIVKTLGGATIDSGTGQGSTSGSIEGDVKDILEGRNTMYNIRQTMGRTNKAAAYMEAIRNKIRAVDPSFDFVASDAGGKSVSTQYVQRATAAINAVLPNIDKIVDLSNQVSRIGVKGVDKLLQEGKTQIGDQKVSNFHQAQKLIADEIGVALGAGSVSDMKLQLGFDVTDPSVTPEVFASNMALVKEFINNRKAGLDSLRYKSSTFDQGQNSQSGSTSFNDPSWQSTYNYDQDITNAKDAISRGADKEQIRQILLKKYKTVNL